MDFAKKIFYFCVLIYASLCSADENLDRYNDLDRYNEAERNVVACFVQHLNGKGKLDETFQSTLLPTSSSHCRRLVPFFVQIVRANLKDEVAKGFPNEASCLADVFDNIEAVDYHMKLNVIEKCSFLSVSDKDKQLEETRSQFKDTLTEIALQCLVDDKNFVQIFNRLLGIKNETLEAYQRRYCMTKYVVDRQILKLENVDINPHQIDTDSVDCDDIMDDEQSEIGKSLGKTDKKELNKNLSPTEQRDLDCNMDVYRRDNLFDLKVALKVIYYLDIPSQVKKVERNRIAAKITDKLDEECIPQ